MSDYSYMDVYIPRDVPREAARQLLTEHAEHGHWELARTRIYSDGSRRIQMRRRIIRVRSTL